MPLVVHERPYNASLEMLMALYTLEEGSVVSLMVDQWRHPSLTSFSLPQESVVLAAKPHPYGFSTRTHTGRLVTVPSASEIDSLPGVVPLL